MCKVIYQFGMRPSLLAMMRVLLIRPSTVCPSVRPSVSYGLLFLKRKAQKDNVFQTAVKLLIFTLKGQRPRSLEVKNYF